MEIRLSDDVEDREDVTLEVVIHLDMYGEHLSRVWDELCDAAERAAAGMRDTLAKVYIIME